MEAMELTKSGQDNQGHTKTYKTRGPVEKLLRVTFILALIQLALSALLFILSMTKGFTTTNYEGLVGLVVSVFTLLQATLCLTLVYDETRKLRLPAPIAFTVVNLPVTVAGLVLNALADSNKAPWMTQHNRGDGYLALVVLSGVVCLAMFVVSVLQLVVLIMIGKRNRK